MCDMKNQNSPVLKSNPQKKSLSQGIEGEVNHKRLYRKIDFQWNEKDIYGRIVTIEYNPNQNAHICLMYYGNCEMRYILHPRGAIIGDTIVSCT